MLNRTISLTAILSVFLLTSLIGCSPATSSAVEGAVCPIAQSPIEHAKGIAKIATLACIGKCEKEAKALSDVVNTADATAGIICDNWPLVEGVATILDDPLVNASIKTLKLSLQCESRQS
jgi:hypothetical protein